MNVILRAESPEANLEIQTDVGTNMMTRDWMRTCRWLGVVLCLSGALAVSSGCDKSPRQKLVQAKVALQNEDLDKAKTNLEEVLSVQKDNLEAKRLMGEVYRLKEQYKRAEEHIENIWNNQGLDADNAELSARQRSFKDSLTTQFVDLYKDWGNSINAEENPKKFEQTVQRGLEYDDRDMDLNGMLVDFYWERGKRLVEEGNKKEAAQAFDKISQLRTPRGDDRRKKAKKKARDLQLEFFKEEGRKRFDKDTKPMISDMDGFEVDGDTIVIEFEQNVDRRLNPNKKKHKAKAKQLAYLALLKQLSQVGLTIAGLPKDAEVTTIVGTSQLKQILLGKLDIGDPDFRRGEYTINAELPVGNAIGIAYDLKNAFEEAQKSKDKNKEQNSGDAGNTKEDAGGN